MAEIVLGLWQYASPNGHEVLSERDADMRVAVLGSGGMTHFVVNEEFDQQFIESIQQRDADSLKSIDP